MKVLDLFCGLKGWSEAFADRGHFVATLDKDVRFNADFQTDILEWRKCLVPKYDVVLASPPCEGFSVMTIGKNWHRDGTPKSPQALYSLAIVRATLEAIAWMRPRFYIIENPRDKLRVLPIMRELERRTVTYCQYGDHRMKPTDLWGIFPPSLTLRKPCQNGDPCHTKAPRGSRTGTQGMNSAEAARVPYALSLAVCLASERDLNV